MTRRGFLASIGASGASIQTIKARLFGWGYVDVNRCVVLRSQGINLRAHFNGIDVTKHCFEADDQLGYVGLFKQLNGQHYIDFSKNPTEAAREWLHGKVEFRT